MNECPQTDEDVLDGCLAIYFLYFYAAEIFHFAEVGSALADAAAQTVDVCVWREEEDDVGGDT